ncbi:HAMP domain-containing histidine kinase [archaeon]|nr:HAMP domain-containing histidine kinase [archaeon]
MAHEIEPMKSSLRNNIVVVFFLVITAWGIAINGIFQQVLKKTLVSEGLEQTVVESIANRFVTIGTGLTIAGIFIVLIIAIVLSRSITRPIEELTKGVMNVAEGKFDEKIDVTSQDELGQLVMGFNFMTGERKKAEEELEEAYAELQKAYEKLKSLDELKSNLIANVTHELRTPLFITKGALELVTDTKDEKEKNELLKMADEALGRQNLIIDDLMAASHLGDKDRFLKLEAIDIGGVISYSVEQVKDSISQKGINLEVIVEKSMPKVSASRKHTEHVMRNLLGNAIKFNKKGGSISIEARQIGEFVEVGVKDTGIGIAESDIPEVFNKFFQADASTSRTYGGTGMGLAIVKELVEAHGGKVGVESEIGHLTRFYFTLQIAKED